MMTRARLICGLALCLGLILTGCVPSASPTPVAPTPSATLPPVATPEPTATPELRPVLVPVTLTYWEQDSDEADVILDLLAGEFTALNPSITVERTHFTNSELRDQFHAATLSGDAPMLVRAPNDFAGPFSQLEIILSLDELFDEQFLAQFFDGALAAAVVGQKLWGIPDNYGRHLMLLYNRHLVDTVPGDTSAWIEQLKGLTDEATGSYGLVYNLDEPYWLVPWLGGFGAWPLDSTDQPDLDSPGTIAALQFVHDLKHVHKVVPAQADYNEADALFRDGSAAYLIDGDWSLPELAAAGMDLGVATLPVVSQTGRHPSPMTTATIWMFSAHVDEFELEAGRLFVAFMTSSQAQQVWLEKLGRLPSHREAAGTPAITDDPVRAGSMDQLSKGRGLPATPAMLCAWTAMQEQAMQCMAEEQETVEEQSTN